MRSYSTLIAADTDYAQLIWLVVLLVVVLAAAAVSWLVCRRYLGPGRLERKKTPDFTLEDIRSMLRVGQISQEEFDTLKQKILHDNFGMKA